MGQPSLFFPPPTYGTAYGDDSVEKLCEIVQSLNDFPVGQIMSPWSQPTEECLEEIETPDPLAFGADVLHYMETSVEEARQEYLELLEKQITARSTSSLRYRNTTTVSIEQPGGLRLLSLPHGPFRLNFEAFMTTEKLKELNSVAGYLQLLRSVNGFMCDEARRLKNSLATATPVKSMKEMQEAIAKILLYIRAQQRQDTSRQTNLPQANLPQTNSSQTNPSEPGRFRLPQTRLRPPSQN